MFCKNAHEPPLEARQSSAAGVEGLGRDQNIAGLLLRRHQSEELRHFLRQATPNGVSGVARGKRAHVALPTRPKPHTMRLAAIDVGSNSVHMVVADINRGGHLEVVDRVKEVVRLGRRVFMTGRLMPEAMDSAARALKHFERVARARRVERLRVVATSAVREASNRSVFLRRIKRETGLEVEVISGQEEARLIFNAARYALGLDGGPHLLLDVGGGSVELVLVREGRPLWLRSFPLGAARLSERFLTSDPPSDAAVSALTSHLKRELGEVLDDARRAGVARTIGTSGTVNSLVAMVRAGRGEELGRLHCASASAAEIERLRRRVLECTAAERTDLPGADAKRADLMPAATILIDFILSRSGSPELVACSWALREGVLLELAGLVPDRGAEQARRRSVDALAARFSGANAHGRKVAWLALQIYDGCAGALALAPESRELLEYAALLHDIGHAIDHDRHHRHTYYLIENGELFGFDPLEIEVIALAARAHRKQSARLDSSELDALSREKRRTVRGLAAILRVADALDRSHSNVVRNVAISQAAGGLVIEVDSGQDDAALELWTAERRADLLARLLDRKVILRPRIATVDGRTLAGQHLRTLADSTNHHVHKNGAARDRQAARGFESARRNHEVS
jgi:exopolyphosphatase/guanosine-5'-triphosphate,3'-diphosphate pyrophosphatase